MPVAASGRIVGQSSSLGRGTVTSICVINPFFVWNSTVQPREGTGTFTLGRIRPWTAKRYLHFMVTKNRMPANAKLRGARRKRSQREKPLLPRVPSSAGFGLGGMVERKLLCPTAPDPCIEQTHLA